MEENKNEQKKRVELIVAPITIESGDEENPWKRAREAQQIYVGKCSIFPCEYLEKVYGIGNACFKNKEDVKGLLRHANCFHGTVFIKNDDSFLTKYLNFLAPGIVLQACGNELEFKCEEIAVPVRTRWDEIAKYKYPDVCGLRLYKFVGRPFTPIDAGLQTYDAWVFGEDKTGHKENKNPRTPEGEK